MPNDDDYETIRNEERGCGFLDHGKGYVRSPPKGSGGVLPPFVKFDPPIPYLERSKFRGYEYFPGISFELAVTGALDVPTSHADMATPLGADDPRLDDMEGGVPPEFTDENTFLQEAVRLSSTELGDGDEEGFTSTDPTGEVWRHIARTTGSAEGDHAGEMLPFSAHDLYMHIGASYYPEPEDFIQEVREQGLSKAIPVSQSQEPPVINPGSTRLFLVHPAACGEENDTSGVIGYVYLSRTIYTEDDEGRFPAWAKKQGRSRDDLDLVHVGDQIYEDGTRATTIDEEDEFGDDEAETVGPSDKEGRDVEAVTHSDVEDEDDLQEQAEEALDAVSDTLAGPSGEESNLDEDAIHEQLDEKAAEFEEFGEDHQKIGSEAWVEATVIDVPTPADCPECGTPTDEETMEGGGVVMFCPSCGWDNSTTVNAALVEHDLRQEDYNSLRAKASDELENPPANPDSDELIRAFLVEWGLIDG